MYHMLTYLLLAPYGNMSVISSSPKDNQVKVPYSHVIYTNSNS